MSQAGYTPIQLYYSTTAAAVPVNTNLANGELAINITDGKLYYKDNGGTVRLLASNATSAPVLSFSAGTTGFTPSTATTGAITLAGTLATTNGGTGLTSFTSGGVVYASSSSALATGSALTFDGTNLILGSANPLFQGSSSTGSASLSNNSAGAYVRVYGGSHATRANFTDFINASSTSTFDSAGNLGIGVTPSAWSGFTASQVGNTAIWSTSTNNTHFSSNTYYNGSNRIYIGSDFATEYAQQSGQHKWFTAASGTAGGTISATQAMTLLANGNLGIGTTNPLYPLQIGDGGADVAIGGAPTGNGTGRLKFINSTTHKNWQISTNDTAGGALEFARSTAAGGSTFSTPDMAITSAGYVGIATTNPAQYGAFAVRKGVSTADTVNCSASFSDAANSTLDIGHTANLVTINAQGSALAFKAGSAQRFYIGTAGQFGIGATPDYGTSGQVLTSGGSGAAPTWTTVGGGGGGSAATPTVAGTVFGSMTAAGGTPFLTALGYNAGLNNTGTYNVFVGLGAGQLNTSGGDNVVVGVNALYSNLTGTGNTAVGRAALNTSTAGTNTAVGFFAGAEITTGAQNTSIGRYSGGANAVSTGTANTSVGNYAGYRFTTGNYNVAVGAESLQANTTASGNSALGYQALYSNSTAASNTAVGYQAGYSTSTGYNNVAMGWSALKANTTGIDNIAIGSEAKELGATGNRNVCIGRYAARSTTGSNNVAVGDSTLFSNTSASNNTAIGFGAGYALTTGANNHLFGYEAGKAITTGTGNIIVGNGMVGSAIATGQDMIGIGQGCFGAAATGYQSIAIGNQSTVSLTSGLFNNGVGYATNNKVTTGNHNNALGSYTLALVTTGSQNVGIGNGAGTTITTGGDNICIGYVAGSYGTGITTGGQNIFIGYGTTPASSSDGNTIVIGNAGPFTGKGSSTTYIASACYQGNNSSTWSTTSDQRLKKNIVDNNVGLDAINSIRVRNFEYRVEEEVTELPTHAVIKKEGVQLGVIAQELQAVLPDCVRQETTGVLSVDPDNLTWYMINAIKQLSEQVETLKSEIATLKGA